MLTAKLMNDKKAQALIAQYNGKAKDVAGYAAAMGVKADTAAVNFAQLSYNYTDYTSPKVAAKLFNSQKGQMFGPMQANGGVVVMQVADVEKNGRPFSFKKQPQHLPAHAEPMPLARCSPQSSWATRK